MATLRYLICTVAALGVAFVLFFAMQALISVERDAPRDGLPGARIDFVRLERDEEITTKRRALPDRVAPPEPPPPPPMPRAAADKPSLESGSIAPIPATDIDIDTDPRLTAPPVSREPVPLVRVEPMYPPAARDRRISGWVEVAFTIGPLGTVENPTVIASEPGTIFDRAALRAVAKWRYATPGGGTAAPRRAKVRFSFDAPH